MEEQENYDFYSPKTVKELYEALSVDLMFIESKLEQVLNKLEELQEEVKSVRNEAK